MNGCARLSDRMPDVVHGRSRWTPDEAAHLAGCADCRRELALVHATVAMGRKAPRLRDPAGLAAAVERRLAGARRRRRDGTRRIAGLAAAAALMIMVWGRWPERPGPTAAGSAGSAGSPVQALVPLPELELLDPAELDSLLQRMEMPSAGSSTLDAPGLGDLEDTELEQVLDTWEG